MAKTDAKTLELIAQVKAKKELIAKAERPSYKTNCSFSYVEEYMGHSTNIHVESDVKRLICMAAFLQGRKNNYEVTAKELLKLDKFPEFTWCGYSAEDWINDIKMRITKIQIASEKKKLESLEERLNKIISPEKRAELELESIEKELA